MQKLTKNQTLHCSSAEEPGIRTNKNLSMNLWCTSVMLQANCLLSSKCTLLVKRACHSL